MARIGERQRMVRVVERWRRSGQTGAAFCRAHGIKPQKLSYWKRVLGVAEASRVRRSSGPRGNAFVPVHLVDGTGGAALEVHLSNGDRLILHEGSSAELRREVLEFLRGRC